MKKTVLALILCLATVTSMHGGVTVGIPIQLLESEHDLLPSKTIEVSYKILKFKNDASPKLVQAIDSITTIVADNASTCRTFSLDISPDGSTITVINHDPNEPGTMKNDYAGTITKRHCHFLVKCDANNKGMVNSTFARTGDKNTYVREFIFVEEKIEPTMTSVEAQLNGHTPVITKCIIENIDLNEDNDTQEE